MNTFMAVDIGVFIGLYVIYFVISLRKQKLPQIILKTCFWLYIAAVLLLTVSPMQVISGRGVDFSFSDMNFYAYQYNLDQEVIANVLLFLPFGFLLPLAYPKMKDFTILFVVAFTLGIEVCQQSVGRVSDLTDVVNNSVGGIIGFYGYVVGELGVKVVNKLRKPDEKPKSTPKGNNKEK